MQGDTAHAHLIHGNSTLCLSMCWFGGKIKKERERKGSRDEDKETEINQDMQIYRTRDRKDKQTQMQRVREEAGRMRRD